MWTEILSYSQQLKSQLKKLKSSNSQVEPFYKNFKKLHQMIKQHFENKNNLPQFFQQLHGTTIDMRMRLLAQLGAVEAKRKKMQEQYQEQIQGLTAQLQDKDMKIIQLQKDSQDKQKIHGYSSGNIDNISFGGSHVSISGGMPVYVDDNKSHRNIKNANTGKNHISVPSTTLSIEQNIGQKDKDRQRQRQKLKQSQKQLKQKQRQLQKYKKKERQDQYQRAKQQKQRQRLNQRLMKQIADLRKQCQRLNQNNKGLIDKLNKQSQVEKQRNLRSNQIRKSKQIQSQPQQQYLMKPSIPHSPVVQKSRLNQPTTPSSAVQYDRPYDNSSIKTSYDNVLRSFSEYPNERNYTELDQTLSQPQIVQHRARSLYTPNSNKLLRYNGQDFWRFLVMQALSIQEFMNVDE